MYRVAAVGDSYTKGTPLRYGTSPLHGVDRLCRLGEGNAGGCRGNYPKMLQLMLGGSYEVVNFAISGVAARDLAATSCKAQCYGVNRSSLLNSAVLKLLSPSHTADECDTDMRASDLILRLRNYAPHVVILLLGTNDAQHKNWAVGGIGKFDCSFAALLRAIWLHTQPVRLIVVSPPPLMADGRASLASEPAGCVRMHNCRYHPRLTCWEVLECITCSASDTLQADINPNNGRSFNAKAHEGCIRADALLHVREHVSQLVIAARNSDRRPVMKSSRSEPRRSTATRIPSTDVGVKDDDDAENGECPSERAIEYIHKWPFVPEWRFYVGPVHLNALGSALLACALRKPVLRACADGCCRQSQVRTGDHVVVGVGNASSVLAAEFCLRLKEGVNEHRSPQDLNVLEAQFAAQAIVHGRLNASKLGAYAFGAYGEWPVYDRTNLTRH